MRRSFFYHLLAWHDIRRLWPSTQHQIVIIAGICLPILLLLGLKRGHVAELQRDLVTSPSGRQIVFWSAQGGALLDAKVLSELSDEPNVDLVIPESQRVLSVSSVTDASGETTSEGEAPPAEATDSSEGELVTLYSTIERDPILAQYKADVLRADEPTVALNKAVARRLGVKPGDAVRLGLRRRKDNVEENHSVLAHVAAIVPSADEGSQTGYAHIDLLKGFEQYVRGFAVPELGLPSIEGLTARDDYFEYLLFCQRGAQTELNQDDFDFLKSRGIEWTEVEDVEVQSLYGVLNTSRLEELRVYRLRQRPAADGKPLPLHLSPLFIAENTYAVDDFVLRWNAPLEVRVGDQTHLLLGLSIPTVTQSGGWIRDYLVDPELGFDFEQSQAEPFSVQHLGAGEHAGSHLPVMLSDGTTLALAQSEQPDEATPAEPADAAMPAEPDDSTMPAEPAGEPDPAELPAEAEDFTAPRMQELRDLLESAEAIEPETPDDSTLFEPTPGETSTETTGSDAETDGPRATSETTLTPAPETTASIDADAEAENTEEVGPSQPASKPTEPRANEGSETDSQAAGASAPPRLLVPANLLAWIHSHLAGEVRYDAAGRVFAPFPEPVVFDKARMYTHTIDHVPEAVERLAGQGYAVLSESTRISEIQAQDQSLQLLVIVVAAGVFFFGVVTVVSVLADSTDRKRGTIGILRVMGMSRLGVFYVVVFRAAIIGLLAAILSLALGYAFAWVLGPQLGTLGWQLPWDPVNVSFTQTDLLLVFVGALACSGIGALLPAWRASSVDPFDAIMEGRFH